MIWEIVPVNGKILRNSGKWNEVVERDNEDVMQKYEGWWSLPNSMTRANDEWTSSTSFGQRQHTSNSHHYPIFFYILIKSLIIFSLNFNTISHIYSKAISSLNYYLYFCILIVNHSQIELCNQGFWRRIQLLFYAGID